MATERLYVRIEGEAVVQVRETVEVATTWEAFADTLRKGQEVVGVASPELPERCIGWGQTEKTQVVLITVPGGVRKLRYRGSEDSRARLYKATLPPLWLAVRRAVTMSGNPPTPTLAGFISLHMGSLVEAVKVDDAGQVVKVTRSFHPTPLPNTYDGLPCTVCTGDLRVAQPIHASWHEYLYGEGGLLDGLWATVWNDDLSANATRFEERNGFHIITDSAGKEFKDYSLGGVIASSTHDIVQMALKAERP